MNYVLAEITRRNIGFHYYREQNGNRAFVPYGSNGPIPLAISYLNGRYSLGKAAKMAEEEGQKEAYFNLFDIDRNTPCCDGLFGGQLVSKVITLLLDDLCKDKFYSSLAEMASDITLVLFYGNDISFEEIDRVRSEMNRLPLAEVKVIDHSQESVKYFHKGTIDDWSGETDGMVVMSDNQDLSVKCYSLSDYKLKYEHRFKNKGVDPRFEWAVNMLWEAVRNDTYCGPEESIPCIKKDLKAFLDSNSYELHSVKLPDGRWPVMLSRKQYDIYSPPGGNQFMTVAGDVVQKAGLRNATTGIVLQGFAADNKSFRSSFVSCDFDPISNENESVSTDIYNTVLDMLLGGEEILEVDDTVVMCPWEGGTKMMVVKSLPETPAFTASADVYWLKTLVGPKEVAIIAESNSGSGERVGVVTLTSPYKRVTKTVVVRQSGKDSLPPQDPLEVTENSVTLPWIGGTHNVGVKTMPEDQPFTAVASDSWIKVSANLRDVAISADSNMGTEERKGVVTLTYKHITKTIEVNQLDKGNRKFKITSEIGTSGGLFKKTKTLKVKVEILDDKALPFDCVFTLSKTYSIMFKPESMYYEDCEPGARGELVFGPYTLPISALGNTDVIYAGIWPAREMPGNPLFKNNQLEIKL